MLRTATLFAPVVLMTTAAQADTGRSAEIQMKALSLETCAPEAAATQTWANRTAN